MITQTPPATWDNGQNVNPEKLNRNIGSARAALIEFGNRRWVKNTVTHIFGTVSGTATWHIPVVSDRAYIVDRITVVGDITGDTGYIQWGMNSTFSTEVGNTFVLNAGTMSATSLGRGTVLPGYSVAAGTDWSDSFRIDVVDTPTTTMTNIRVEVALRYDRNPGATSDPYSADLATYSAGDELTAARHNAITNNFDLYAASWTGATKREPPTLYYVQLRSLSSSTNSTSSTVPLPGSGPETFTRILARADLATNGGGGQNCVIAADYGTWGTTTPTTRLTISVAGVTSATGSTGTINVGHAARSPATAADDLLLRATTGAGTTITNVGIWVLRSKTEP